MDSGLELAPPGAAPPDLNHLIVSDEHVENECVPALTT